MSRLLTTPVLDRILQEMPGRFGAPDAGASGTAVTCFKCKRSCVLRFEGAAQVRNAQRLAALTCAHNPMDENPLGREAQARCPMSRAAAESSRQAEGVAP